MGFDHWVMEHFWSVIIASLVLLVGAHFLVTWLLTSKPTSTVAETTDKTTTS
jgi:hypothetical protein